MAKTISEIKKQYIRQGLRGADFSQALKNDPEYQKLLRIRRLRILTEETKKKSARNYDGVFFSRLPKPKEEDRSLAARAAKLDQKIENYIKNKFSRLIPRSLRKILIKIAKQ